MDHHASGQPSHTSSFQWLSFAYQGLTEIPYETILTQTETLEVLDLSYNLLDEYPFPKNQKPEDQTATQSSVAFFLAFHGLTNILTVR